MNNLHEAVAWMLQEGYLVVIKGMYKVTAKFNKEISGKEIGLVVVNNTPLVMETPPPAISKVTNWPELYTRFIMEAEVPRKGESSEGSYDLNKYSEPAMKVFKKLIETKQVEYPILVKSTLLYYKTHKRFAVTIGNYIEKGYWRTDYMNLLNSAADGNIEGHIKEEIDSNTEFSRFKQG